MCWKCSGAMRCEVSRSAILVELSQMPELQRVALKCAATARFDWVESGVGKCAGVDGLGKGSEGIALLQESVVNSVELGIT